jgi:hypothetical protein
MKRFRYSGTCPHCGKQIHYIIDLGTFKEMEEPN